MVEANRSWCAPINSARRAGIYVVRFTLIAVLIAISSAASFIIYTSVMNIQRREGRKSGAIKAQNAFSLVLMQLCWNTMLSRGQRRRNPCTRDRSLIESGIS